MIEPENVKHTWRAPKDVHPSVVAYVRFEGSKVSHAQRPGDPSRFICPTHSDRWPVVPITGGEVLFCFSCTRVLRGQPQSYYPAIKSDDFVLEPIADAPASNAEPDVPRVSIQREHTIKVKLPSTPAGCDFELNKSKTKGECMTCGTNVELRGNQYVHLPKQEALF